MIDCLLIGPNDQPLDLQIKQAEAQGRNSEQFRTLNLSYIEYDNKPFRPLELINHIQASGDLPQANRFENIDFIQTAILHLGSYLARAGFTFDFISLFQLEKERLKTMLQQEDVLSIGISTTLYSSLDPIMEIIKFIRTYNDKVAIILGGPFIYYMTTMLHPTMTKSFLKKSGADFLVINREGELALTNIIKGLKGKIPLHEIDNIVFKKGQEYVITNRSEENHSLEEFPIDFHRFPQDKLKLAYNIRFSKSCPFSCAYCIFPTMSGTYVKMSMESIERHLDCVKDAGIRFFDLVDDTLNTPISRYREFLDLLIRKKYDFEWSCFFRCCNDVDEFADQMAEAGCRFALLGVESGSDVVLQAMNKRITKAQIENTIISLQRAGISTFVSLIGGFPGETRQTFRETTDLLLKTKPDFFKTNLWMCHPLSAIWKQRDKYKIKGGNHNWSHATMNSREACDLIYEQMSEVEDSLYYPEGELINMFYLIRQGWSFSQVKQYVKAFNHILKQKLPMAKPDGLEGSYMALKQSIPLMN